MSYVYSAVLHASRETSSRSLGVSVKHEHVEI